MKYEDRYILDQWITSIPERTEPDFFKLAKEKYDTYEDMLEWLGLSDLEKEQFLEDNWYAFKEEDFNDAIYYQVLTTQYENTITDKFIKQWEGRDG